MTTILTRSVQGCTLNWGGPGRVVSDRTGESVTKSWCFSGHSLSSPTDLRWHRAVQAAFCLEEIGAAVHSSAAVRASKTALLTRCNSTSAAGLVMEAARLQWVMVL